MTTIMVCDIHMIQPKASPDTSLIPKTAKDELTAMGYIPIPPLVADMANAPAVKATKSWLNVSSMVSGTVNLITQNMPI